MTPKGPSRCHGVCIGTKFGPIIFWGLRSDPPNRQERSFGQNSRRPCINAQMAKGLSCYPEMARVKILGVVWMANFFRLFGLTDWSLFGYFAIALILEEEYKGQSKSVLSSSSPHHFTPSITISPYSTTLSPQKQPTCTAAECLDLFQNTFQNNTTDR